MDEVIKEAERTGSEEDSSDAVYDCGGRSRKKRYGREEEDSWKSILLKEGYEVRPVLKGLGEIDGIRRML